MLGWRAASGRTAKARSAATAVQCVAHRGKKKPEEPSGRKQNGPRKYAEVEFEEEWDEKGDSAKPRSKFRMLPGPTKSDPKFEEAW